MSDSTSDASGSSAKLTPRSYYAATVRRYWPAYLAGIITLFLTNLTESMVPKFVQWTIDTLSGRSGAVPGWMAGTDRTGTLHHVVLGFLGMLILGLIGRIGWRQLLARRTHVAGLDMKVTLWDVLRFQPFGTFHRYPLGDLMNRAIGDWGTSRSLMGFTVVMTLDLVFFTTLALISMFMIDVQLAALCVVIFPFLVRPITRLARREHDLHVQAQDKLGELSEHVSQSLATIRLQRATRTDGIWQERLRQEASAYAARRFEVVRTAWKIFPLGALPTILAYAVLLWFGYRRIMAGTLSVGEFVAMQSYVLMLQDPLFQLGDCIAEWQRGVASLGRLLEVFNLRSLGEALSGRNGVGGGSGTDRDDVPVIDVRDLTFSYGSGGRKVLDKVEMKVFRGEVIGIAGPVGAGKTTLLSLLAGLHDAPAGSVQLMGADVNGLSRAWLASHVRVVPQKSFLFAGTVRTNLELDLTTSEEELWRVLRMVSLEADVHGFPDGLNTWIGEWGVNLSGGQKQRLALARAMLRPCSILLLDDCLSAVDAVTEERILATLQAGLQDTTVIWVAHRMSTLKLCDRVYHLADGVLVPDGETVTPKHEKVRYDESVSSAPAN